MGVLTRRVMQAFRSPAQSLIRSRGVISASHRAFRASAPVFDVEPGHLDETTKKILLAESKKGLPRAKRIFALSMASFGFLAYCVFKKPSEHQIDLMNPHPNVPQVPGS